MHIRRALAAVVLTTAMLSGCSTQPPTSPTTAEANETSTPAPAPTKPALADLIVTPEGIGDVIVGEPPRSENAETALLTFVEGYCQPAIDELIELYGSEPGLSPDKWVANFEPALSGQSDSPFAVSVVDDAINLIVINDPALQTGEGVGLGSTRAELLAAYPNATLEPGSIANTSELYVVEGEHSRIEMEISLTNEVVGLENAALNTVWSFRVNNDKYEPTSWAGIDAGSAVTCIPA
jgi:hypothetical protein